MSEQDPNKTHRLSIQLTRAEMQLLHDMLDKPMMETTDPRVMGLGHRLRKCCTVMLAVTALGKT